MVLDRQKVWTADGIDGWTDGCTDEAKTISIQLNPLLHSYSCLALPAMNNYINKVSRFNIEQRNYLSVH